ncbi:MAG: hypothetical protein HY332_13545 [Chloroflexi bacterium]|nr:hypothetical protein [Chloroflexota bacterium]
MPQSRFNFKLRTLYTQRDDLRRRLAEVEGEIAVVEQALGQQLAAGDEGALAHFAAEVEDYLGAVVIDRAGDRVQLRRRDERGDVLCIALASGRESDGTWWSEIHRVRDYLVAVKNELAKQGRL